MPTLTSSATVWRKSSYSAGNGSNADCVEVAFDPSAVAVRDSKAPDAGRLALPAPAWRAFVAGRKA